MKGRVLIADDHEIVREGLRRILAEDGEWEIVGEATDGRSAVELARRLRPDVAILDYSMPGLNGLEATRQIRADVPRTEVLVLTMHDSELLVKELLEAGAKGYVLKSDAGRLLTQALDALREHKPFFTAKVAEMLLDGYLRPGSRDKDGEPRRDALTAREREVIQLIAEGRSTKEIADRVGISVKTAETHRANLLRKLGLHSVADVVRYAIRNKIIEP